MRSNLVKLTVVLLAGLLLLGTAGAVSAGVGTLGINLSTGEITGTDTTYTGYVEFTPVGADFPLNSFRIVIQSDDPQVKLTDSAKVDELFKDYGYFDYVPMRKGVINDTYTFTANLAGTKGVYNVSLTDGETYKILPFTISAPSSVTNVTVNLSFISDALDCYVGSFYLTGAGSKSSTHVLGSDLSSETYMLDNETANSIKPESVVYVDIETNETIFDGNVTVFSELVKVIENSSDRYFLNYSSSKEDVVKFYNNITFGETPKFVVLKGTDFSEITVNLTNKTSGAVIDSKTFTVNTKKIDITADMFNFTDDHVYPYNAGKSVETEVLDDVKEALLNHSVGAANTGDDAQTYGYVRDIGKITLTFFNSSLTKVEPIDAGVYTFNISIAGNDNYYAVDDLQLTNHTITINGGIIRGVSIPLNISQFNAVTPAMMKVEFNATGVSNLSAVYYAEKTSVEPYKYFNAHNYLTYNVSAGNFSIGNGSVYNVSSDNKWINFTNNKVNPVYEVTYFVFEGFPRGDVSMNGAVRANDASLLATYITNSPIAGSGYADFLTDAQKFYGNVKGSERLSGNDVRLIAQYAAGYVDADYIDIRSQP